MKTWQSLIIGMFIGLILGGAIYLIASPKVSPSLEYISPTQITTIKVSVNGNVAHPGLYELQVSARVNDAITAAGGALDSADLANINLAEPLQDGEMITVSSDVPQTSDEKPTTQGKIDLNIATAAELDALPGIGSQKAQAIIDYRNQYGNFSSIDDLLSVPGFGSALVNSIRDLIEVK
jgi:competence protein ComEA